MRKCINLMIVISMVVMNNNMFYAATRHTSCDWVTASESTTANCNQRILTLENESFEELGNLSFADYQIASEADVLGWESTAPAGTIELWKKSFYEEEHPNVDSSMIDGDVLAELNSNSVGALYQDFETEPGQTINIYAKHGGRIQKDLHGEQNMGVYVGEPRTDYSNDNYSPELYPTNGLSNDLMYSSAVLPGEWNEIAFQYVVPEGQTTTRIAFNSLDLGSMGNFIDEIKVGVDSIYDNEVMIESETGGHSFADTYRITNVLNHIGGDEIGKFEVFIDTSGLKNLRQFEIRDMDNNDVTSLVTVEYIEEDHIKITGGTFIEGTVTFLAESTLEETGEIVVDSNLKYVSELYLDFVRLGQFSTDGVLETRDIESIQLVDDAPVISFDNITVNEGELSSGVNIEQLLKISVEDREDNITGFETELVIEADTIDYHKPGVYNVYISATDGEGQTRKKTATITIVDVLPEITTDKDTIEIQLKDAQKANAIDFVALFNAAAKEISTGDLNPNISVDYSAVNFNATGTYDLNFIVSDDEGNKTEKTTKLVITRSTLDDVGLIDNTINPQPKADSEIDVNEDTTSEVTSEDEKDTVDETVTVESNEEKEELTVTEENSENNVIVNSSNTPKLDEEKMVKVNSKSNKYEKMTLSKTGKSSILMLLIAILLVLVVVKKLSNKKVSVNL